MKVTYFVYNHATRYTAYQHENYDSAKAEATRLARAHPGTEFMVLAAIASVKKVDVIVDEVPQDQIPF